MNMSIGKMLSGTLMPDDVPGFLNATVHQKVGAGARTIMTDTRRTHAERPSFEGRIRGRVDG